MFGETPRNRITGKMKRRTKSSTTPDLKIGKIGRSAIKRTEEDKSELQFLQFIKSGAVNNYLHNMMDEKLNLILSTKFDDKISVLDSNLENLKKGMTMKIACVDERIDQLLNGG